MTAASNHQLSITPTPFLHWPQAYRCRSGELELTVVASIGPRILSLRLSGGPNLLALDPADFRVGDWRLYGGHRFTTAPEGERSYAPDNLPCGVRVSEGRLALTSYSPACGVQKCLEISARSPGEGFVLRHTLVNAGASAWRGAPWAITCVSPLGNVILPRQSFGALPPAPARFWNGPPNDGADAFSAQWLDKDEYFLVRPNGKRGKIGLFSACPWIAWVGGDTVLRISCPHVESPDAYPDNGCNLEVFTCRHYLELEHLGPLTTLLPGHSVVLEEHWEVLPVSLNCEDWNEIKSCCEPRLSATPEADFATVTSELTAASVRKEAANFHAATQPHPNHHG